MHHMPVQSFGSGELSRLMPSIMIMLCDLLDGACRTPASCCLNHQREAKLGGGIHDHCPLLSQPFSCSASAQPCAWHACSRSARQALMILLHCRDAHSLSQKIFVCRKAFINQTEEFDFLRGVVTAPDEPAAALDSKPSARGRGRGSRYGLTSRDSALRCI